MIYALIVLVVGLMIWRDVRRHRRIRAGEAGCEVCGTMTTPICMDCCRCKNPRCNGGCIYCREDMPFGRKVKVTR